MGKGRWGHELFYLIGRGIQILHWDMEGLEIFTKSFEKSSKPSLAVIYDHSLS